MIKYYKNIIFNLMLTTLSVSLYFIYILYVIFLGYPGTKGDRGLPGKNSQHIEYMLLYHVKDCVSIFCLKKH